MYKILLPICFLAALVAARSPRIANGLDAKDGDVKDFVQINVFFETKWQYCGGLWYKDQWVLTTSSCVVEPLEQVTNITVVFPGLKGSFRASEVKLQKPEPPTLPALADVYSSEFALIFLPTFDKTALKVDPKKNAETSLTITTDLTTIKDSTNYKICGFGSTDDRPNHLQAKMKCANVTVVPTEKCTDSQNSFPTPALTPPTANIKCLAPLAGVDPKVKGGKGNACAGDYGGAVYTQDAVSPKPVALLQYSPNYKIGSSCTDGHYLVATVFSMEAMDWITKTLQAAAG